MRERLARSYGAAVEEKARLRERLSVLVAQMDTAAAAHGSSALAAIITLDLNLRVRPKAAALHVPSVTAHFLPISAALCVPPTRDLSLVKSVGSCQRRMLLSWPLCAAARLLCLTLVMLLVCKAKCGPETSELWSEQ